jgi:hypothetical protein
LSEAELKLRSVPSVWRTSGMSGPPSVITISPFDSGVTVGYQRPAAMLGPRLQVLVAGLKRWVWLIPLSAWSLLPPAMNNEPSSKCASPLQKML